MAESVTILAKKVKDYIHKHNLILPGQRILVAVSGGADSVGLILLLAELKDTLRCELAAAHFDHRLRPASAQEGDFTEDLAKGLGIPVFRGAQEIGVLAQGKNLEDVARRERYAFLREAAKNWGADRIATAHHAGDQAETVLLHLLRGCGTEGMAAINPLENDLIRPLLDVTKAEIEQYLKECGQGYCLDESNLEDRFLRNRVRHRLLPALAEYNPRVVQSLGITAEICREENNFLQAAAQIALAEIKLSSSALRFDQLTALPPALKRRVLRLAYEEYAITKGSFCGGLAFERTEAVFALKDGQKQPLAQDIWVLRDGNNLRFSTGKPGYEQHPGNEGPVCLGDWQDLCGGIWQYRAEIVDCEGDQTGKGLQIALPAGWLPRLSLRTRRDGDIFTPAGFSGHKKIKKVLQEVKMPLQKRNSWPLLLLDREIIWIPGYRRAEIPHINGMVLFITLREKVK